MSLSSDIIRGHTETVILAQLLSSDSYGYQINKALRDRSGGAFEAKEGTLYTAFRRLEESGCIRSYWGDEQSGARRRYYSITPGGAQTVLQQQTRVAAGQRDYRLPHHGVNGGTHHE